MITLKARADFLGVSAGRKAALPGLLLQMRPCPQDVPGLHGKLFLRVGYTASRKVGIAVARNRAKRRLRAVARAVLPRLGKPFHDYVLVGRAETVRRPYVLLLDDLEKALKRVHGQRQTERTP